MAIVPLFPAKRALQQPLRNTLGVAKIISTRLLGASQGMVVSGKSLRDLEESSCSVHQSVKRDVSVVAREGAVLPLTRSASYWALHPCAVTVSQLAYCLGVGLKLIHPINGLRLS